MDSVVQTLFGQLHLELLRITITLFRESLSRSFFLFSLSPTPWKRHMFISIMHLAIIHHVSLLHF